MKQKIVTVRGKDATGHAIQVHATMEGAEADRYEALASRIGIPEDCPPVMQSQSGHTGVIVGVGEAEVKIYCLECRTIHEVEIEKFISIVEAISLGLI